MSRPLPNFEYVPTAGGELSQRQDPVPCLYHARREREVTQSQRSGRPCARRPERQDTARLDDRLVQGAMTMSTTTFTPYVTHSRWTAWLEEQEQISKPRGEPSGRRGLNPERYTFRGRTRSPTRGIREPESRREELSPRRRGRERRSPSIVEVEHHPDTPIKVSGIVVHPTPLPFSTSFSAQIINAPYYEKVKMPTMDLYDGTTDPDEHLGVCARC